MKTCVYCGKSLADTATRCKYCECDLPLEPLPTQFQCNSCGTPLDYDGVGVIVKCPICDNSVIVPTALRIAMHPKAEEMPLSETIARLLQEGNEAEVVRLLRERASLPLEGAIALMAILKSGTTSVSDLQSLIVKAMRGDLP